MIRKFIYSLLPIILGFQSIVNSAPVNNNVNVKASKKLKYGISLGINFINSKTHFKISDSLYNLHRDTLHKLVKQVQDELNNELFPYKKPVDISKKKNNNKTTTIKAYTQSAITSNNDGTKLPNSTTIYLNTSSYDSGGNKTKYILLNTGNTKYNASTGLIDNSGSPINDIPVEVHPDILKQNNIRVTPATTTTNDTTTLTNYIKLTAPTDFPGTNVKEVYITPRLYEQLKAVNNSNNVTPTHVCKDDLGPVTQAVLKSVFNIHRAFAYQWILNFNNNNDTTKFLKYNKKLYINSKSYPNLGFTDTLLEDIANSNYKTLRDTTWKSFNDLSKWGVDLSIGFFTDIFFNKNNLMRIELSGFIPVHNRTLKIIEENELQKYKYGVSIEKQLSFLLKLLYGHCFKERFKFLIGLGIGYNHYKLKLHNLYSQYSIDNYPPAKWMQNVDKSISNDYYNKLKNQYGIDSDLVKKEINKFSAALILGFEFDVNKNNSISIEMSVNPENKLMKSKNKGNIGTLTVDYISIGVNYRYVF